MLRARGPTLVSVSDGGFVSHAGANQLTTTQAAALTYSVTRTGDAADGSRAYVVIRIPDTEDVRDFRIRQSFSGANYYVTNWHTIGSTGGFTYGYSTAYALCRVSDPHSRGDQRHHDAFPWRE